MPIPLNGRIAIVDDKIDQALPLMNLFGKLQIPYIYYNSDSKHLPPIGNSNNDIRILFLDINLIDDSIRPEKEIKSKLYATINRIVSVNNYPYLLIYWSRHESEHNKLVEDLFQNELKERAPISCMSLQKADYFELSGDKTVMHDEKIPELLDRIKNAITALPIYSYLMKWENLIHSAADDTLEEIFKINNQNTKWHGNSNYLFYKLASSYSGKNIKNLSLIEQIKSGFCTLNLVFNDTLEYAITSKFKVENPIPFDLSQNEKSDIAYKVNKKLLVSTETTDTSSPGIISIDKNERHNYGKILNNSILRYSLYEEKKETICEKIKDIIDEKIFKKTKRKIEDQIFHEFKESVKKNWLTIEVNVTPVCDFAQEKEEYSRIIPGLLIENQYKKHFDTKTEALFISPSFMFNSDENETSYDRIYFILLDFRFFTSIDKSELHTRMSPILRIRQQLLTEIQSKLARHVNRQGILFLDEQ